LLSHLAFVLRDACRSSSVSQTVSNAKWCRTAFAIHDSAPFASRSSAARPGTGRPRAGAVRALAPGPEQAETIVRPTPVVSSPQPRSACIDGNREPATCLYQLRDDFSPTGSPPRAGARLDPR